MPTHAKSQKILPQPAPSSSHPAGQTPALLSNQTPALTRQTLRQLQRMKLSRLNKTSAPAFIQSKLTRRIQRRVPEPGEVTTLLGDANAGIAGINLKGLKTAVERMMKAMPGELWIQVEVEVEQQLGDKFQAILKQDDPDKLQQLIDIIKSVHKDKTQVEYPVGASSFELPSGVTYDNLIKGVKQAHQIMLDIAAGNHDRHGEDVFGDDPTYGWEKARPNFLKGATQLNLLMRAGSKIGADRTGESAQMDYGALTEFETSIMLEPEVMDNPTDPESIIIIIHESMHAGVETINDNAYSSEPGFSKKTPQEKFTTAAFYEEVARRVTGKDPVGGVFEPGTKTTLTHFERARDKAVDRLRVAWIVGINAYFRFKSEVEEQDTNPAYVMPDTNLKNRLYLSTLLGLTFHQRHAIDPNAKITTLDMMLAEGATRIFDLAGDAVKTDAPMNEIDTMLSGNAELADPVNEDKLTAYNVKRALEKAGPVHGSIDRDMKMIELMTQKKLEDVVKSLNAPPAL